MSILSSKSAWTQISFQSWAKWLLLTGVVMATAVFFGLVAVTGNKILILLPVSIIGGLAVVLIPIRWTFWGLFVLTFIVIGVLRYFAEVSKLQWLPYLMALAIFAPVGMRLMLSREPLLHVPAFLVPGILFLLVALFSSALEGADALQAIMAAKSYFFLLGVLVAMIVGGVPKDDIKRIWWFLLLVAVLQFPTALYQYVFVAGKRAMDVTAGGVAWDSVVGTFGGDAAGGGNSGAMGYFLSIATLVVIALKQQGLIKLRWVILIASSTVVAVFLAEVKAVFLYLPFGVFLLYWRQILRRPTETIMVAALVGVLLAAMPFVYDKLHYSKTGGPSRTLMERIEFQADTEAIDSRKRNLPRGAQLGFWWGENVARGDFQHTLFGYGMGATRSANVGAGKLTKRYFYSLEQTSSSILLWETGIFGLLLVIILLLSASWKAWRLAQNNLIQDQHRALFKAISISLILAMLTLFYSAFAMRVPGIQLLIIFMLGHVAYWSNQLVLRKPQSSRALEDGNE